MKSIKNNYNEYVNMETNCCLGCVMSIHVACLWMCFLFYFSFVCLHVCAYASKTKVHCGPGSAVRFSQTLPVCLGTEHHLCAFLL